MLELKFFSATNEIKISQLTLFFSPSYLQLKYHIIALFLVIAHQTFTTAIVDDLSHF